MVLKEQPVLPWFLSLIKIEPHLTSLKSNVLTLNLLEKKTHTKSQRYNEVTSKFATTTNDLTFHSQRVNFKVEIDPLAFIRLWRAMQTVTQDTLHINIRRYSSLVLSQLSTVDRHKTTLHL